MALPRWNRSRAKPYTVKPLHLPDPLRDRAAISLRIIGFFSVISISIPSCPTSLPRRRRCPVFKYHAYSIIPPYYSYQPVQILFPSPRPLLSIRLPNHLLACPFIYLNSSGSSKPLANDRRNEDSQAKSKPRHELGEFDYCEPAVSLIYPKRNRLCEECMRASNRTTASDQDMEKHVHTKK